MKIFIPKQWFILILILTCFSCERKADVSEKLSIVSHDENEIVLKLKNPDCEITIRNINDSAHIEFGSMDGHSLLFSIYEHGDVRSRVTYQGGNGVLPKSFDSESQTVDNE